MQDSTKKQGISGAKFRIGCAVLAIFFLALMVYLYYASRVFTELL